MLEEKGCALVSIVNLFAAAFLDRAIRGGDDPPLTAIHVMYSGIVNEQLYTKPEREKHWVREIVTSKYIRRLKLLVKNLIKGLEAFKLFTLKFHMRDQIMKNVGRFCVTHFLDAFPFEYFELR